MCHLSIPSGSLGSSEHYIEIIVIVVVVTTANVTTIIGQDVI